MNEPEVIIRRQCRHGEVHPHNAHRTTAEGVDRTYWCVAGDVARPTLAELTTQIFDVLTDRTPRVPTDDAMVKARQIVEDLHGLIRPAPVVDV